MQFVKNYLGILLIISFSYGFAQDLNKEKSFLNHDNRTNHIQFIENIKENIEDKLIVFNSINQKSDLMPDYQPENMSFKIVENTDLIQLLAPNTDDVFKRGEIIEIRWTGGNPGNIYSLDLYNGKFHYKHLVELKNSGVYLWVIPKDVVPGKEYKFKLTNIDDFGEYFFSEKFIIKRKIPIAAWIIPGAIIVTGVAILIFYDGTPQEIGDLPEPIIPE
jgi:hypothetical protein